jgi:sigma-54 dependent transcriptional regulator, acetoin dehydrogenase operon transcriptional activator AcoR
MTTSRRAPTTLTAAGDPSPSASAGKLSLVWLFPRPTDPMLELELRSGEECIIGRDDDVAIQLSDPNVSRRHARVRREGADTFLLDLGSRNGTRVNGRVTKAARLALGDVVRVGDTVGLVTDLVGSALEMGPGLHAGPLLQAELAAVRRAAPSDLPVILEGETGTGKEVVARSIHAWSGRSGPFVAVNCAALPEGLAEGELFGYRRGAFTGAERASLGLFRTADGGTLLLDEVADLPLVIQAKLLRVLEQREVQPLGESQAVSVNTRVIVAAQDPLTAAVERRAFRADLLARLDGVTVRLPPLRERLGDVPELFQRLFALENAGVAPALEPDFVERLCLYDWPFNVREVVLLAKRLRVLCDPQQSLRARDLPRRMLGELWPEATKAGSEAGAALEPDPNAGDPGNDDSPELRALLSALRACHGNVAQAAVALGISRQRAYRVMQGHAVDLGAVRREVKEEAEP